MQKRLKKKKNLNIKKINKPFGIQKNNGRLRFM